ncbi:RNA polymerase factor sigma-70 [Oceanobacter sp. 5_MG-2023]|uniref:RNA polymerase factor sigma-70 n=1 Tax=Oceanobacter sp. 5_MG-2023 TaxID=3062645 RepID=UPI0026E3C7A2|nr:RNA polymerase factor sigma-70 [Oceanobacter sp. 5_MG-2023]MDO6681292.1 RNA polymerase factor sigma-70 [Oceanobacter sp. 5_MG-2023]
MTDTPSNTLADRHFLEQLRHQMLSFARLQLNDDHLAEDAVQEALAGALKNADAFKRQAALKTWVFAILKNKITDILRQKYRSQEHMLPDDDDGCKNGEELDDQLFDHRGHWQADERPQHWGAPQRLVYERQFWQVFDACLNHLPAQQARVFMMREFLELSSNEICSAQSVSVSNLHVLLYRARLQLRECLENNWFSGAQEA